MAGDKAGPLASSGQPSGFAAVLQGASNIIGEGIMALLQKAGVSPQDCHDFLEAGAKLAANITGQIETAVGNVASSAQSTFKTIVGGDGKFTQVAMG